MWDAGIQNGELDELYILNIGVPYHWALHWPLERREGPNAMGEGSAVFVHVARGL